MKGLFHSKTRFLILFFCFLFCWARISSAEPSLDVHLDKDHISMDDTITLTIVIKGGSAMATPDIPAKGNFDVVGRSVDQSVSIVNGEMIVLKTFEFVLAPRAPGKFSIGPIRLYVDGKEYSAGPVQVKVTDSSSGNQYQANPTLPQMPSSQFPIPNFPSFPPPGSMRQSPTPSIQAPSGQDTFVTAEVNKKEAYVGEQLIYTFRAYTAVSLQQAELELPEFKDFINEELIKEKKYQVDLNGRRYLVNEWRMALFPTKAGVLETGDTKVKAKVPVRLQRSPFDDPFMSSFATTFRSKTFTASSLKIQVKPLPPSPNDFTGLVGEFSLVSSLSRDQLKLGETANLKVEISGKGNIREGVLPTTEFGPSFKVYSEKPEVKLEKTPQGLSGKKIFNYALVAEKPGNASLPVLNFSYFNPATQSYEKFSIPSTTVHVLGNLVKEQMVTAGLDQNSGEREKPVMDISPIKSPQQLTYSQEIGRPWNFILVGLVALGPFSLSILVLQRRWRRRFEAQADDRKRSRAFKRARSALTAIKGETPEQLAELSQPIKNYLGDRFRVKGAALTPLEVEELLKKKGLSPDSTRRMVYLLEQLEQWRYGGAPKELPSEKILKQEILNLLREMEKAA